MTSEGIDKEKTVVTKQSDNSSDKLVQLYTAPMMSFWPSAGYLVGVSMPT